MYTNSSGASSLAEDLYVPNDPPPPMNAGDEYMDMTSEQQQQSTTAIGLGRAPTHSFGASAAAGSSPAVAGHFASAGQRAVNAGAGSGLNSVASSCSITSGTPSTDMRFGEFQLDKVISIFTPDEEEQR